MGEPSGIGQAYGAARPRTVVVEQLPAPARLYARALSGVIGRVQSMAAQLAARRITINAVAPGFIETQMTAKIPLAIREAGRRMNSMSQGGQPVDVAQTVAWLAHPGCAGITGQVVRVCGQSLIGA